MPSYLNPIEAKAYLEEQGFKVSTNFLRVRARNGLLPHTKIGSRYLFTPEQLETLITQNAHASDFSIE